MFKTIGMLFKKFGMLFKKRGMRSHNYTVFDTTAYPLNAISYIEFGFVDANPNIFYVDANGNICTVWTDTNGNQHNYSLKNTYPSRPDSPLAYGQLDDRPALFYITADNRLCYLIYRTNNAGVWDTNYINPQNPVDPRPGNPPNSYDTALVFGISSTYPALFYYGANNQVVVCEQISAGNWVCTPLWRGLPAVISHYRSLLFDTYGGYNSLFVIADDGTIYRGFFDKPWTFKPLPAPGLQADYADHLSPLSIGHGIANGLKNVMFFINSDRTIWEIDMDGNNRLWPITNGHVQNNTDILYAHGHQLNFVFFSDNGTLSANYMNDDMLVNWTYYSYAPFTVREQSNMKFYFFPNPSSGFSVSAPVLYWVNANNQVSALEVE